MVDLIKEFVELGPFTTLKIGGQARYFAVIHREEELLDLAHNPPVPLLALGGGSNTVFPEGVLDRLVLKIEIKGFEVVEETPDFVVVSIGAGEEWDSLVARTVERGWWGLEALSMIPGTAGAAPVQNIGAYGQEISQTLVDLTAFDVYTNEFVTLDRDACHFSYRDSIFKSAAQKRYIITSIRLRLSKKSAGIPPYKDVEEYFAKLGITQPTLTQIRQAVMEIRARKLPDPSVVPNAGSFFKNPIVALKESVYLKEMYPTMPLYPVNDEAVKLSAGWLIQECGLKGVSVGKLKTWPANALVLTNPDGGGYQDLCDSRDLIISKVEEKFGVILEPEPVFI